MRILQSLPVLVFLLFLVFDPALPAQSGSWYSESLDRGYPHFDTNTGLPIIDIYGRQKVMMPEAFRPFVVDGEDGLHILRYEASLTPDPPEYDPETGFPIFGDYFRLNALTLSTGGNHWIAQESHTPEYREIRSPGLIPNRPAANGFAAYHIEGESLIVYRVSNQTATRHALPVNATEVSVVVSDDQAFHAVWIQEGELWHGFFDTGSWNTSLLENRPVLNFRTAGDIAGNAHLAYTVESDGESASSELVYRSLHRGEPATPEAVLSSLSPINGLDLAVDDGSNPLIAYVDPVDTAIGFARRNGQYDWQREAVFLGDSELGSIAIALDNQGNPGFAYVTRNGRELRFSWSNGSGWEHASVSSSEYSGFFLGVTLNFHNDAPLIIASESEFLYLKAYSPHQLPPLFPTTHPFIEMKRAYILEWDGDVGFEPVSRLEWTADLSNPFSWQPLEDAEINLFTDSEGQLRFRTTIEVTPEPIYFRAVVTTTPED